MGNKSGKTKPEYNSESQHREAFLTDADKVYSNWKEKPQGYKLVLVGRPGGSCEW